MKHVVIFFWTMIILPMPLAAQSGRLVLPHFAADQASFETKITIENRSKFNKNFSVRHLNSDGSFLSLQNIELGPGERRILDIITIDGTMPSHAVIDAADDLFAGVTFIPSQNTDHRIFVEAINQFSKRWRVYPNNWKDSFDGLVIVNPGCFQSTVRLRLFNEMGELIEEIQRGAPLAAFGKWVLNLEKVFEYQPGAFIEIHGDQNLAVLSLKGTKDSQRNDSFLVGNLAITHSEYEEMLIELRANRDKWSQTGFGGNYSFQIQRICFCSPETTAPIQIEVADFLLESLTYVESGQPLEIGRIPEFHTITSLFNLIESAFDSNVANVQVSYHETQGYPISVSIDLDACLADEEITYIINELGAREAKQ